MMLGDEEVDPQPGDVKIEFVISGKDKQANYAAEHLWQEYGNSIKGMKVWRWHRSVLVSDSNGLKDFAGWSEVYDDDE